MTEYFKRRLLMFSLAVGHTSRRFSTVSAAATSDLDAVASPIDPARQLRSECAVVISAAS
jgi:hypothetical protein